MKQTTQKFLARLLALLLVLGLAPEVWAEYGSSAAQAAGSNYVYLYDLDNRVQAGTSASNQIYLGTIQNSGYLYSRTLTVGEGGSGLQIMENISWKIGNQTVLAGHSYTDPYTNITLAVAADGKSATVSTHNYNYSNSSVSISVTVSTGSSVRSATCYVSTSYNNNNYGSTLASVVVNGSYYLGETDANGKSSIVSQLDYYSNSYNRLAYVRFTSTSHTYGSLNATTYTDYWADRYSTSSYNYLSNVLFTPSNSTGTAYFGIEAYYYTNGVSGTVSTVPVRGSIAIDSRGGVTSTIGDITYPATIGETVYFNVADFENLYYDKTNGGSLTYVTFNTPSTGSGSLYANNGTRLSSGSSCYVSPSSRQNALDSVYFTPSGTTASRANTVRIGFTAYGNRSNYGTNNRTVTGTVVINYLSGTATDITYTPLNGSVKLNPSDFTNAYRQAVGGTAPSNLTIQFQEVPSNGTLTYSNTTLRSSNIKSYYFTTRNSGDRQLNNVTYTSSGGRTDSISYIAYVNNTAQFSGEVIFNPSTLAGNITVALVCSGSGVSFNQYSFTQASPTVMANCTQIHFTIPGNGTLTYGGSPVTSNGVTVPVSQLSSVYYRPNANFNRTDQVAFICYNASGAQIGSGQVSIVVSGNTGSSGATNVSQFTDIPKDGSANWYLTALSDLVSRGIVQGTGNGKAEPRGTLNYGQALKMILLAAGYPTQAEPSGNDWAINYKNLAVSSGIVSSNVVLTAPITRDAVVEIAAKALKISPVTGNSPFSDSTNGYAIALNRTSPQIIVGNANGTFNGSGTLLRQEIWVIVQRMYQYASNQYSTQMPDGI